MIRARDFDLSAHFYFSKEYISLSGHLWIILLPGFSRWGGTNKMRHRSAHSRPLGIINLDNLANFILESVCRALILM